MDGPRVTLSFLLSQLGGHAAQCFAGELAVMGLRVQDAGLLRMLGAKPGMTQIEIAETFAVLPSRLVVLIDALEDRGLVRRKRDVADRRKIHVSLTPKGTDVANAVAKLTKSMEHELFRALDDDEKRSLEELLRKVVVDQGLLPGVHPAFAKNVEGERT
jgi:DNA-binding MarR family transcriptional regulator